MSLARGFFWGSGRLRIAGVLVLVAALACDEDPVTPDMSGGSIVIQLVQAATPQTPDSVEAAPALVTPAPAEALTHLDSARATITPAAGAAQTVTLTKGASGFSATVSSLAAGSYTLTVLGYAGGEVDYYGSASNVAVTASQTTTASITWGSFIPSPATIGTPTAQFRFNAAWTAITGADSYKVEIDKNSTFSTVTRTNVTAATGTLTVTDTGTYYLRVRSSNPRVPLGRASATQTIQVVRNPAEPGDNNQGSPTALGYASGGTQTFSGLNIFPASDQDWFSVNVCQGDSLNVTARAAKLTPASNLNSFLQLNWPGDSLLKSNDDSSGTNTDAFVATRTTVEGPFKIRVSGTLSTIGGYDLIVIVVAGPNQGSTGCKTSGTNVASVVLSPASVALTSIGANQTVAAQPKDGSGTNVTGKTATWISLNPGIATVNSSTGQVTAVAAGQTAVAASVDGVVGYAPVQVNAPGATAVSAWSGMTTGQTQQLNGVWGFSPNETYFAVGANGLLLRYTGSSWTSVTTGTTQELKGIFGFSNSNAIAVGANGTIIRYDAGAISSMASGTTRNLNAIWGVSPTSIYAVGNAGTILRFNGATWSAMTSSTTQTLYGVWGTADNAVWAVGANGTIVRYDGTNWITATSNTTQTLYGVWGSGSTDVVAVGAAGTIVRFGGSTWSTQTSTTTQQLNAVWGSSIGDIYAAGNQGVLVRYGPTPSWAAQSSGTAQALNGIAGFSGGNVYAVGVAGTAIRGQRGSSTPTVTVSLSPAAPNLNTGVSQGLSAQALDGSAAAIGGKQFTWRSFNPAVATVNGGGTVTAVNAGQTVIAASTDGVTGYALITVNSPGITPIGAAPVLATGTTVDLQKAWASGPNDLFVAGSDGRVRHYDGSTWTASLLLTCCQVSAIWGLAPDEVYAITGGAVYRFDGLSWRAHFGGQSQAFQGIWAASPRDIHAVGNNGAAYHYDGTSWQSVPSGTGQHLFDVWGAAPNAVFAVGDAGTILKWNGSAWSTMTSNTSANLKGVWGTSGADVYAVGADGVVVRYNGSVWSVMTTGLSASFTDIWGSSATDIYLSSNDNGAGTLFRHNGTTWVAVAATPNPLNGVTGAGNSIFPVGNGGRVLGAVRGAATVSLTPAGGLISSAGGTFTFAAAASDIDGIGLISTFTCGSLNAAVVTVLVDGSNCVATATGTGQAIVSGSADAATGYGVVTVIDPGGATPVPSFSNVTPAASVSFRGLWGTSGTNVYAVGLGGAIHKYNGTTWTAVSSTGTTSNLLGIWGSSPNDIYAYGPAITHYDGATWSVLGGVPAGTTITAMWGSSPFSIWAAFGAGMRFYNGAQWSSLTPLPNLVNALWGSARDNVIAVGAGGMIQLWDGNSWADMPTSGTWPNLNGVWGTAPDDIWAVGANGTVIHYNGSTWAASESNTSADLLAVYGISSQPGGIIAVGASGTVLRYDGTSWHPAPSPTVQDLKAVWTTSASEVIAAGNAGALLRGARSTLSAPNTPTNLIVSVAAPTQLDLTWTDNSTNEDGFSIERCSGASCSNFAEITAVAAGTQTFSSTGLTANTSYSFRVRAYNAGGASGYTGTASSQTPTLAADMLSAGGETSCLLHTVNNASAVDCFGGGDNGQLGNGSGLSSSTPVRVTGAQQYKMITVGGSFACGLTYGGVPYCWGSGFGNSPTAVSVPNGATLQMIAAASSGSHACGVTATSGGAAYCWGYNSYGQLGNGTTTTPNSSTTAVPVTMPNGVTFASIAPGGAHTCARTSAGGTFCWGYNWAGQLGESSTTDRLTPTPVYAGLVGAFSSVVAGSSHTCGIASSDGKGYCWGYGGYGQGGDNTNISRSQPTLTYGGLVFSTLTAGNNFTCGVAGSTAYCWGDNGYGQLGTDDRSSYNVPTAVASQPGFTTLVGAYYHTCGRISSGSVYCWGWNRRGQLGNGDAVNTNAPMPVGDNRTYNVVTVGRTHTCAITTSATLFCWGNNGSGQVGDGTTTDRKTPMQITVPSATGWTLVSARGEHTCGINSGTVYCWGYGYNGELGDGLNTSHSTPTAISGGATYTKVAAGDGHTCGLQTGGGVYCWGYGGNGQVGRASTASSSTPVSAGAGNYVDVSAGSAHSCAIAATTNAAYCWGYNFYGQLGNANTTDQNAITLVTGAQTFASLSGGDIYTCGRTTGSAAYCWGYGGAGNLGDGASTFKQSSPSLVSGAITWASITAGQYATCGVTSAFAGYCWGNNYNGELGTGDYSYYNTPHAVAGGLFFSRIQSGEHTCGFTTTGAMYCWGNNDRGQFGNGLTTTVLVPPGLPVSFPTSPVGIPLFGRR